MSAVIHRLQPKLDRRALIARRVNAGLERMHLHVSDDTKRAAIARATSAAEHAPVESVSREAVRWICGHSWPTNTPPGAA